MQATPPAAAESSRRPLKSRQARWARIGAQSLARLGFRPNQISVASVGFAALAAAFLLLAPRFEPPLRSISLLAAAIAIQLRLLCNLMDGMVAVEGGFRSPSGEIFNDLPDRISDVLILLAAGYSLTSFPWGRELGFSAAVFALLTAYVRVLGSACGNPPDFSGPMAKPHRMAVMTAACLLSAAEAWLSGSQIILAAALAAVSLGSLATLIRRTARAIRRLESQGKV